MTGTSSRPGVWLNGVPVMISDPVVTSWPSLYRLRCGTRPPTPVGVDGASPSRSRRDLPAGQRYSPAPSTPYVAWAAVNPSYSSCSIRPLRENGEYSRYSLALATASASQSTCSESTAVATPPCCSPRTQAARSAQCARTPCTRGSPAPAARRCTVGRHRRRSRVGDRRFRASASESASG